MIWKAGGKQRLVLNTDGHTYHDQLTRDRGGPTPTLQTLNVRDPFIVADVRKVRVDVVPSTKPVVPGSAGVMADVSIPARVDGSGEFCLAESLPVAALPFGHGLEIVSGIPEVDALVAERLAPLKGLPIRWSLTVRRQIEGGEETSATSTRTLSDFRTLEPPAGSFSVPRDYRYQEPVIVGPIRQKP